MKKNDLVTIREYKKDDKNFIFATFLRSLYYDHSLFSFMPKNDFMQNYHKVLEAILAKKDTKINMACLKDDIDAILGYSILNASETVLHFVYVKPVWRKIGVATLLTPSTIKSVTHLTKAGTSILKKKHLDFNPFLL